MFNNLLMINFPFFFIAQKMFYNLIKLPNKNHQGEHIYDNH